MIIFLKKNLYFSLLLFLFAGCKSDTHNKLIIETDSTLTLQYAKGFTIAYKDKVKIITVNNPWNSTKPYARYYLVSDTTTLTPKDGQTIHIPLQKLAVNSGTHFEFIQLIGEINSIKGIANASLIYNEHIRKKIEQNELVDMGDPFNMNIERIQFLAPDALMVSGFNQEDPVSKRLIINGTPVIFNNEWMENTLLGRAEWIKFVAAFYNKEALSDSIFAQIATNYLKEKNRISTIQHKPKVMVGGNFKGTWYMPGGKSYMACLLADAGANYFYATDSTSGSLPLNFEVVLAHFRDADYWIGSQANSREELLITDQRHGLFSAVAKQQVYNFNQRTSPSGANDFWESAVARPDILLKDMIKIFHPEHMQEHNFFFAAKLP